MTTSVQIEEFLQMKKNFLGCFPCNQLPSFPKLLPKSMVVNTDKAGESGEHWVALFLTKNECLYFDSFGLPILEKSLLIYLRSHYTSAIYSNICIQEYKSDRCGLFCIGFVQSVKDIYSYLSFIKMFDDETLEKNDHIIAKHLK